MTRNNIKNYFVMFVLILSASSMAQNNAFATSSPNLGTAGSFAVLASSTITCTGAGAITGNVGVSPGTAIVLGTPPCTVSGAIHAGDAVAAQAQTDAASAYGALTTQACTNPAPWPTNAGNREMSGLTLGPGVYCSDIGSSLSLAAGGTLTLSGAGVYIFKAGSTLVTVTDSNVVLTNGATAANVFWQVGSSATLAAPSSGTKSFPGTIIATASISESGGTTGTTLAVDGRLLALNGAVTFASTTTVTVPTGHGTGNNGNGDNDKCQPGTGDNDKGEHDEGHGDKDGHGTGDNNKDKHCTGEHDEGHGDKDHHGKK